MTFLEHLRDTLTAAAPDKYPLIIDKEFCSVAGVYDEWVDLHPGSADEVNGSTKVVSITGYTRSVSLDQIKSIEPLLDWRVIRVLNDLRAASLPAVSADEIEKNAPGLVQALQSFVEGQTKG